MKYVLSTRQYLHHAVNQFSNYNKQCSLSTNVIEYSTYSLDDICTTSLCSEGNVSELMLQRKVIHPIKISILRGSGNGSDSGSSDDNNNSNSLEDKEILILHPTHENDAFVMNTISYDVQNMIFSTLIPLDLPAIQPNRIEVTDIHQHTAPIPQRIYIYFCEPNSIINAAAVLFYAGDHEMMLKVLEILDKHLVLPEDIDMAKEFGQGFGQLQESTL